MYNNEQLALFSAKITYKTYSKIHNILLCGYVALCFHAIISVLHTPVSIINRLGLLFWKYIFKFLPIKIPSPFINLVPSPSQYPNILLPIDLLWVLWETLVPYQWSQGCINVYLPRTPTIRVRGQLSDNDINFSVFSFQENSRTSGQGPWIQLRTLTHSLSFTSIQ